MEPVLPITIHVDFGARNNIDHCRHLSIDLRPALSSIVSSHKVGFAIIMLVVFAVLAKGTSIVLVVTNNRIIVASDGVVMKIEDGVSTFPPFCKIRKTGHVWYVVAGDYGMPGTTSDVWKIAENSIARSKKITDIYTALSPTMLGQLPNIVERNRVGDPKTYSRWIAGDPVIEMAFAGFEDTNPLVIGVSFYIDTRGTPVNPPSRNILHPTQGTIMAGRLGYHNEIEQVLPLKSWQQSFWSDPVGAAHQLIQIEIDAAIREKRYDVGLPISIIRISRSGGGFVKGYEGSCGHD
jgi:hypothetical protein